MAGDLTKNFSRKEFACKDNCGFDTVDYKLLQEIQELRYKFGLRIDINSACRCETHNKAVGGSPNSQHLIGRAADIVVVGMSSEQVYKHLNKYWPGGLGQYDTFTHIDSRVGKARW